MEVALRKWVATWLCALALTPGVASAADPCPSGYTEVFCQGSKALESAAASLNITAGYFFALARAPIDELRRLKIQFSHNRLNALMPELSRMNANNEELLRLLDLFMKDTQDRQGAWDKVVAQARKTLEFILPITKKITGETFGVVKEEADLSDLIKYMDLKAAILVAFPTTAPKADNFWLKDFADRFTTYTKSLGLASKAVAAFNNKLDGV
jgi:hypothetical protein